MPKLATKEYCTGCTACASACPKACITMTADKHGFLFPVIDDSLCVDCRLCEHVCPIVIPVKVSENTPQAYAAYSIDEETRLSSSSGGIFSEIANSVLSNNGAVFGAAYDEQFMVVHVCVECMEDLAKLQGAKYAQSNLNGIIVQVKERLDNGQEVLFSGTPCQVGSLKAYLRKDYANLLTVDFVCHSVPSPSAWSEYVKYRAQMDNNGELPEAINLRSKQTGWSRYQYSNLFLYQNGDSYTEKSGESLYMKLFVDGYINRESCANCHFKGYHRVSDFTIGDFWGIWDIAPEMDDNKGTSIVLVHSSHGQKLLQSISNRINLKSVTLEEASRQNPALIKSFPSHERRQEILSMIGSGQFSRLEQAIGSSNVPMQKKYKQLLLRVFRKLGLWK